MSNDYEEINGFFIFNRVQEPCLLHKICCLDDFGDIGVSSEVEQYTKSHDPEAFDT